jgi:hypothetical protein
VRRAGALVCVLLCAVAAGCGFGEGDERGGAGVELQVTRDFGHEALGSARIESVREGQTVMRLLRSEFDIDTRYGGRFVQAIDGLEGGGPTGQEDWFFYVNGVEASVGAAEFELSPGDRVQWDWRDWQAAMRIPAIVGAYPEPFVHGLEGERRPVRVECERSDEDACREARATLDEIGASPSGASLGAPGTETITRLAVGRWPQVRIVRGAGGLEEGPGTTGVFARFDPDGRFIELLDEQGDVARTVRPGDGVGILLAMRPLDDELVWLATGLDERGVAAAVAALDADKLRDAFAVAVTGSSVEKLPLVEP